MTMTLIGVVLVVILLVLLIDRSGMNGDASRVLSLAGIIAALLFVVWSFAGHG